MNYNRMPGPGDEATWGRCNNHPHDPRTPDFDEVEGGYEEEDEDAYILKQAEYYEGAKE